MSSAEVRFKKLTADFGKTANDYGRHRAGFPDEFFERLKTLGILRAGIRALDLGTGTGTIARGLATRGCEVTGLDRSAPLMEQAAELDRGAGAVVKYVNAAAEETGLAAAEFDLVTAGQCWHWFDRPRAAAEARRVLKPEGRLVIAHFDWIVLPGNMTEATEKLIEKHNPKWKFGGGLGIYPLWPHDMAVAGFVNIERFRSTSTRSIPMKHGAGGFAQARGSGQAWSRIELRHLTTSCARCWQSGIPRIRCA